MAWATLKDCMAKMISRSANTLIWRACTF